MRNSLRRSGASSTSHEVSTAIRAKACSARRSTWRGLETAPHKLRRCHARHRHLRAYSPRARRYRHFRPLALPPTWREWRGSTRSRSSQRAAAPRDADHGIADAGLDLFQPADQRGAATTGTAARLRRTSRSRRRSRSPGSAAAQTGATVSEGAGRSGVRGVGAHARVPRAALPRPSSGPDAALLFTHWECPGFFSSAPSRVAHQRHVIGASAPCGADRVPGCVWRFGWNEGLSGPNAPSIDDDQDIVALLEHPRADAAGQAVGARAP